MVLEVHGTSNIAVGQTVEVGFNVAVNLMAVH